MNSAQYHYAEPINGNLVSGGRRIPNQCLIIAPVDLLHLPV